jgi:serine/threonine protein kinase
MDRNHAYESIEELYEFHEKMGEGGFSEVYRATFIPTDEEMAVKILKENRWTEQIIEMFKQEAELLARLNHPNVVKVYHLIKLNNVCYMGMEMLRGGSLQSLIKSKFTKNLKFSDKEASRLMKGILAGVQYIHANDIIHRDLKPQNILIGNLKDLTTVKLIDFGLGE